MLYTSHHVLNECVTVYYKVNSVKCVQVRCKLYNVHCTLYSVKCIVNSIHLYSIIKYVSNA